MLSDDMRILLKEIERKYDKCKDERNSIYSGLQRDPPLGYNLTTLGRIEQLHGEMNILAELRRKVRMYGDE